MNRFRIVKGFLRSPTVILGEIAAFALSGVLGATLPQAGRASLAEVTRLRELDPAVTVLVDMFALDHVFKSFWFLALTLLAAASLSVVVIEQVRRLRVLWPKRLTEAQFRRAPFRAEFVRPARPARADGGHGPRVEVRTKGRLGLAGSPAFHTGLLIVIVAGALRALFAVSAAVDLIEGETLPPTAADWSAQWPGLLAKPFRLDYPVTLDAVRETHYETGDLKNLRVRLSLKLPDSVKEEEILINQELRAPGGRLYLGSDFGPTAMLEWEKKDVPPIKEAVLLNSIGLRAYRGSSFGPDGRRAYLHAQVDRAGNRPMRLDVRVVEGRALLFAGQVQVGDAVPLPGGQMLRLHGLPFWARLNGSRDPALWLAYVGFALALAGATAIFTLVKVDTCVSVNCVGDRERVFVALRAQRFAPLYQDRFQRLVREQGGKG